MTAPSLKVSTPEDIGPIEKVTEVVELPIAQNGRKPVIRIRAINGGQLALAVGDGRAHEEIAVEIARMAIVEPEFTFGDEREPGKAWWGDLVMGNQRAALENIDRISGINQSKDAEVAANLARFPGNTEGRANGAAAGAPVRARAKAAR